MNELKRIETFYKKRIYSNLALKYSLFNSGELYMLQRREQVLLNLLKKCKITNLTNMKILEVGCGRANRLADFQRWGADPSKLTGIDFINEFVSLARSHYPNFTF